MLSDWSIVSLPNFKSFEATFLRLSAEEVEKLPLYNMGKWTDRYSVAHQLGCSILMYRNFLKFK